MKIKSIDKNDTRNDVRVRQICNGCRWNNNKDILQIDMPASYRNIQFVDHLGSNNNPKIYNLFFPTQRFFVVYTRQNSVILFDRLYFFFTKDDVCYIPPLPHLSYSTGNVCVNSITDDLKTTSLTEFSKCVLHNFYCSSFAIDHVHLVGQVFAPWKHHENSYKSFLRSWKLGSERMFHEKVEKHFPYVERIVQRDKRYQSIELNEIYYRLGYEFIGEFGKFEKQQ
jgi:hypothetical protein